MKRVHIRFIEQIKLVKKIELLMDGLIKNRKIVPDT